MKEIVEVYLRRARSFEEGARFYFNRKEYDLAMFNLEQAFQLYIKAKLLDLKGSFQKTHSLRKLLKELAEVYKKEEIEEFVRKNKVVLRNLERAYISSRYYYEEFFEEEVKEAFDVLNELKKLLWSGKNTS